MQKRKKRASTDGEVQVQEEGLFKLAQGLVSQRGSEAQLLSDFSRFLPEEIHRPPWLRRSLPCCVTPASLRRHSKPSSDVELRRLLPQRRDQTPRWSAGELWAFRVPWRNACRPRRMISLRPIASLPGC
ncbi:hypothetical protein GN956_G5954 [Arapaima gigas]